MGVKMRQRLVRINKAASYVGQSPTTFWRNSKAGVWPAAIAVGNGRFVDLDEIDARIEQLKAEQRDPR
jgi:predicted DNA-binding transcriptional regulator AlpA